MGQPLLLPDCKSLPGSLPDPLPLKLPEQRKEMEDEPAKGSAGVELHVEAAKSDTPFLELLQHRGCIGNIPKRSVQLRPDNARPLLDRAQSSPPPLSLH